MNFPRFVARRMIQLVPVIFGIVLIVFLFVRLIPGDPASIMLGAYATPDTLAALRADLGLDRPIWAQFGIFLGDLAQGQFGSSMVYRRPVLEVVLERMPATMMLTVYAVVLSLLICVPLAVIAALHNNGLVDQIIRSVTTLALAMPTFWLGLNLLILFAVIMPLFPVAGYGATFGQRLWHLFLPALTIALHLAPTLMRTLRSTIIEVMQSPHVEFARTKGLPPGKLIRRHVLRNGLMATVTILGVNIGWLMGGSVVIENVFNVPGLGSLIISSVDARDYPVIQGIALVFGLLVIVINLATDLVYAVLDPRVTYE
ncbi:MAG: ABC transporter permease [Burkholderiales bacterium]|nr:ABC transporter permease [Burkholderiales bacterium]